MYIEDVREKLKIDKTILNTIYDLNSMSHWHDIAYRKANFLHLLEKHAQGVDTDVWKYSNNNIIGRPIICRKDK